jgi:hypothetical protein
MKLELNCSNPLQSLSGLTVFDDFTSAVIVITRRVAQLHTWASQPVNHRENRVRLSVSQPFW